MLHRSKFKPPVLIDKVAMPFGKASATAELDQVSIATQILTWGGSPTISIHWWGSFNDFPVISIHVGIAHHKWFNILRTSPPGFQPLLSNLWIFSPENRSYCRVSQNQSLMSLALNNHNRFYCETDPKYDYGFLEEVAAHLRLTDRVERYTKQSVLDNRCIAWCA